MKERRGTNDLGTHEGLLMSYSDGAFDREGAEQDGRYGIRERAQPRIERDSWNEPGHGLQL